MKTRTQAESTYLKKSFGELLINGGIQRGKIGTESLQKGLVHIWRIILATAHSHMSVQINRATSPNNSAWNGNSQAVKSGAWKHLKHPTKIKIRTECSCNRINKLTKSGQAQRRRTWWKRKGLQSRITREKKESNSLNGQFLWNLKWKFSSRAEMKWKITRNLVQSRTARGRNHNQGFNPEVWKKKTKTRGLLLAWNYWNQWS